MVYIMLYMESIPCYTYAVYNSVILLSYSLCITRRVIHLLYTLVVLYTTPWSITEGIVLHLNYTIIIID